MKNRIYNLLTGLLIATFMVLVFCGYMETERIRLQRLEDRRELRRQREAKLEKEISNLEREVEELKRRKNDLP